MSSSAEGDQVRSPRALRGGSKSVRSGGRKAMKKTKQSRWWRMLSETRLTPRKLRSGRRSVKASTTQGLQDVVSRTVLRSTRKSQGQKGNRRVRIGIQRRGDRYSRRDPHVRIDRPPADGGRGADVLTKDRLLPVYELPPAPCSTRPLMKRCRESRPLQVRGSSLVGSSLREIATGAWTQVVLRGGPLLSRPPRGEGEHDDREQGHTPASFPRRRDVWTGGCKKRLRALQQRYSGRGGADFRSAREKKSTELKGGDVQNEIQFGADITPGGFFGQVLLQTRTPRKRRDLGARLGADREDLGILRLSTRSRGSWTANSLSLLGLQRNLGT